MWRKGSILAMVALVGAMTVAGMDPADARSKAGSIGSRGTRTYQAPPTTSTAPNTAAPIQRSATPQTGMSAPAAPTRSSWFGSGFGGSLMRGLLIGGLVGMLFGGGLGGLSGFLGLLLQGALLALGVMLVLRLLRGRQPVPAGAAAGPAPGASGVSRSALGGLGGLGGHGAPQNGPAPRAAAAPGPRKDEVGIGPADYDAFERLLGEVQDAYGREDQAALRERVTPEMFSLFSDELRDNAARGVRNDVSDVKLLQGDLAEAWREGATEYATVALRYASRDVMRDRTTGAVVSGDAEHPGEAVELWTYVRPRGGAWRLSAIQEA